MRKWTWTLLALALLVAEAAFAQAPSGSLGPSGPAGSITPQRRQSIRVWQSGSLDTTGDQNNCLLSITNGQAAPNGCTAGANTHVILHYFTGRPRITRFQCCHAAVSVGWGSGDVWGFAPLWKTASGGTFTDTEGSIAASIPTANAGDCAGGDVDILSPNTGPQSLAIRIKMTDANASITASTVNCTLHVEE